MRSYFQTRTVYILQSSVSQLVILFLYIKTGFVIVIRDRVCEKLSVSLSLWDILGMYFGMFDFNSCFMYCIFWDGSFVIIFFGILIFCSLIYF